MATWPLSLPVPLVEGYTGSIGVPAEWISIGAGWAQPIDRGNPIQRPITAAYVLTPAQQGALAVFHRDHADEWATVTLQVADDAAATVEVLARIYGPINWSARARGIMDVTVSFEVAPA